MFKTIRKWFIQPSNTANFAMMELEILGKTVPDSLVYPFKDEIIALAEKFGKSGQGGGSAPYTAAALADTIKKLLLQRPICDVMGIEEEWMNVAESMGGNEIYQNKRCGNLFKEGSNGRAYYLDAIVFKGNTGNQFISGQGVWRKDKSLRISSHQYVKSFPFIPKTFYIDVIETEVAKNDWESEIENDSQLDAVFKYYDLKQ